MPAVDPTTTDRVKGIYTGPFGTHSIIVHKKSAATTADFLDDAITLFTKLAALLYSAGKFTDALVALAGSDIFIPIAGFSVINSTSGAAPDSRDAPGTFLNWNGRDLGGVRVRLFLFETVGQYNSAMRYNSGSVAAMDDVVSFLNDETTTIGTIAGGSAVWKSYTNVGQNDYLTHKARRAH